MKGDLKTPVTKMTRYVILLASLLVITAHSATLVGNWTPLFKGVDYSVSTNTPSATMPNQHVVHALKVDLTDPDIQFRTTPRVTSNYQNNVREVVGLTVSAFLTTHQLQAAINANFFTSPGYYPP